jgi:hypothetical protein
MLFPGISGWSRCGKIEVDESQRLVVTRDGGLRRDELLSDTRVITMLPALSPTQTIWSSDGRRSARPDCRIQWHRYGVAAIHE